MSTQTSDLGLNKPAAGDTDWAAEVNENWDKIDDILKYISTPIFWHLATGEPDAIGQGTWENTRDTNVLYNAYFYNMTHNNGDNFSLKFRCPKGTYKLRFNFIKDVDCGICKVYIDDVQVGVSGGYDGYAASIQGKNVEEIEGLSLSSGEHTLKFIVDGKNASSADHYIEFSGICLQRTA
jgi:hypothetical protein